ncbi:MAG: hypothetical protein L6425_02125 [Candidatus Aminicenantes bacterium]|nr:hypothetical protein [Candidatus Aminicenantes bacterium]
MKKTVLTVFLIGLLGTGILPSSERTSEAVNALSGIFSIPSPTGYEHHMAEAIRSRLPSHLSVESDNLGSLYIGDGEAGGLAVVCGMDEGGYIVSGITKDGYLTIDRVASASHGLYDFYNIGHGVRIITGDGEVTGVLALPSLHIASAETRQDLESVMSLGRAHIDIGTQSAAEVEEKGVRMLDPVLPMASLNSLLTGKELAGPALSVKAPVSTVLAVCGLTSKRVGQVNTTFGFLAQTKFPARRSRTAAGMGSVRAAVRLKAARVIVVDVFPCLGEEGETVKAGSGPVLVAADPESELAQKVKKRAESLGLSLQTVSRSGSPVLGPFLGKDVDAVGLFIPVRFPETPSELIHTGDLDAVYRMLIGLVE